MFKIFFFKLDHIEESIIDSWINQLYNKIAQNSFKTLKEEFEVKKIKKNKAKTL